MKFDVQLAVRHLPHRDNVEEYIIANDTIEVVVGGEKILLTKGDAMRYIADKEHAYTNNNAHTISFSHIVYYHK